MDFALAVYERRTALGLSSTELAERAGLTPDEVERIEESSLDPVPELVEALAVALEQRVAMDELRDTVAEEGGATTRI
ncbi:MULTISPECIES: helix-turn-helix domain-containing protein [unclassified Streptomyces]|uniref:helix-turn-helix domain-containing protein n=1 Tax=unclassified Streptomyces TaxID=2593676 RepID=UPI0018767EE0|nr:MULTISPECIES: helix-turn-helix transcriptional regulator [unclassified Streptomyces]